MALTIETGAGIPDADSYATVAEVRAYAASRGISLPAADGEVEILLRQATDFLDSLESRYKGDRVASDQALAWPRSDVYLFESETPVDITAIPDQLKRGQMQLACDANTFALQPTGSGREVVRQKVDVIETEYAKTGQGSVQPVFNKAMAILEPLLTAGGMSVQTLRV